MPLLRYFVFVGGALLALLLVSNAYFPKPPVAEVAATPNELPMIRIHSAMKWPQRVVIDTSLPTIIPTQTARAERDTSATVADVAAPHRDTRCTLSRKLTAPQPKQMEPTPRRKHRVARRPMAPPTLIAQQRPFNFFASNSW